MFGFCQCRKGRWHCEYKRHQQPDAMETRVKGQQMNASSGEEEVKVIRV